MIDLSPLRARFVSLPPCLDERSRRLFAAAEAVSAGYGGIAAVARASGIAVSTTGRGLKELRGAPPPAEAKRAPRRGRTKDAGHKISRALAGELINARKFSLQGNRKTLEGSRSPDRDAQFHRISDSAARALAAEQPVISADTKKKELVGDFKSNGGEWRPLGSPEAVRAHGFTIPELGRAAPCCGSSHYGGSL